jgi:hypothetical protein
MHDAAHGEWGEGVREGKERRNPLHLAFAAKERHHHVVMSHWSRNPPSERLALKVSWRRGVVTSRRSRKLKGAHAIFKLLTYGSSG